MSNTESDGLVLGSPGSHLTEFDFINAITGGGGPDKTSYRLPEFVSSFLLVKDLELETFNTKPEHFSSLVAGRGHTKAIFCFKLDGSKFESKSRFHKTASGMKIKVPGAQLIGYYMQKIPKFPVGR